MLILRLLLRRLMEFSFKGKIETLGGALAGLVRSALFASIIMLLLGLVPHDGLHKLLVEDSVAGRAVYARLGPVVEDLKEKYPALQIPTPTAVTGETPATEDQDIERYEITVVDEESK
jgi:uncharacterized membrane protein required for colicin V production